MLNSAVINKPQRNWVHYPFKPDLSLELHWHWHAAVIPSQNNYLGTPSHPIIRSTVLEEQLPVVVALARAKQKGGET